MIISLHLVAIHQLLINFRIQYGVAKPGANQDFELENPFSGKSTEKIGELFNG